MKKRKQLLLIAAVLCFATGCSTTELEERCFPQLVLTAYREEQVAYCAAFPRVGSSGKEEPQINEIQVDTVYADTFADSKSKYEGHLNKLADYNHLKVLVLEESILKETEAYNYMLESLAETEAFPRNTYVCVVADIETLKAIEDNLPQDLGTYLEEYLQNHEKKKERLITLGNLIDEKANQKLVLYLPYLEIAENYVEWGGYYAVGAELPPIQIE